MKNQFDVIIVGAGVVGLSLAASLSKTNLSVAIVEAREFKKTSGRQHARVSAYNLSSKRFFTELSVWQQLPHDAISDFQKIEVWDASGDGEIQFDCVDIAKPALAYIIQNQLFVEALLEQNKATLFCPCFANAVKIDRDNVEVDLGDQKITGSLIVAADGANSWLRKQLNVPMSQYSYESSALICNVQTEKPHEKTARQVFLETGPLAFLPLSDPKQCSIVWSTTEQEAARLNELSEENFCEELTRAFQHKLGRVEKKCDDSLVFPLYMRHVKQYVGHRFALIGDAAHTLHPLAGQGINLGLQDAKQLAEVIQKTAGNGRDIGRLQNVRPFERARKGDNQLMISAMQGFKTLFGTDVSVVKTLRNKGLNITNSSRLLKQLFMGFTA